MSNVEGLTRDATELIAALGGYASLMCDWQEHVAGYRSPQHEEPMREAERKAWEQLETSAMIFIDELEIFLNKRRALRGKLFDRTGRGRELE